MKLLIVPNGMSLQDAYEIQKASVLNYIEITQDMPDEKITHFLNIIKKNSGDGKIYGLIDNQAIPIEEIPFINDYYNRINNKKSWMFWKRKKEKKTIKESKNDDKQPIQGGDGLSISSPAIINCSSMPMAKYIANDYISRVCGSDCVRGIEATVQNPNHPGKRLRLVEIKKSNGEEVQIFFDFSKPMSNLNIS